MTAMMLVTVGEDSRRSDRVCVRWRGYPGASQGDIEFSISRFPAAQTPGQGYARVGEYRGGALILFT